MKKTKIPSLVTIAILTVITILFWIVFGVIRILTLKPSIQVEPHVTKSFSPELETTTLDKIQEKLYFGKEDKITLPLASTISGEVVQ